MSDVFEAGKEGFGSYRIPALLKLKSGVLLAFCEARQFLGDHAKNKIVLKRSLDNGCTWGDLQLIADEGDDALNNPTVVQESVSGDIILMYQKYPFTVSSEVENLEQWVSHTEQTFMPNFNEGAMGEGYDGKVCETFIQRSTDDGITWSTAENITRQVKRATKVTCYASGPGVGIQLQHSQYKGRIVMPYNQGPWGHI